MVDTRKEKPAYFEIDQAWIETHKSSIRALKSLREGVATQAEQILALNYILDVLCARASNQYYPSERDTTFALGRKFVGDQIVGAINAPMKAKEST